MACRYEHALLGIELDLQIIVQVRTCLTITGVPVHVQLLLCCDPRSANVTVIFVFHFTVTLILQMKADSKRGVTYIAVYNYRPLLLYCIQQPSW